MAITKFTDVADTGYDIAINRDTTNQTERDKFLAGLVTKIDELTDLLNNHITDMAANNAKTGITTAQANAITANTAKVTFPGLGTSSTTALAGDTKLVGIGSNTTLSFGDLTSTTVKGKTTYSIVMTATRDFGGKVGSQTKSLTLTLI